MDSMSKSDAEYYVLNVAKLPDALYTVTTPQQAWLELCETAGAEGFAPGSLGTRQSLTPATEAEVQR